MDLLAETHPSPLRSRVRGLGVLVLALTMAAVILLPALSGSAGAGFSQFGPSTTGGLPPGTLSGRVTTAAGAPLAGIQVSYTVACGISTCGTQARFTDGDGRYRLAPIPAGTHIPTIFFIDPLFRYADQISGAAGIVGSGQEVVVDVSMSVATTISGRVTMGGEPVAGALISSGTADFGFVPAPRLVFTNNDGRYVIGGLAPDDYVVSAYVGSVTTRHDPVATSVAAPATGVDLELSGLAVVTGRVTDSMTGLPLRDVSVAGARTDLDGRYRAFFGVAATDLVVGAVDAGPYYSRAYLGPLSVSPGQLITGQDLALLRGGSPSAPPAGTTVSGSGTAIGSVPTIRFDQALELTTTGCANGLARYSVLDRSPAASALTPYLRLDQPMAESPSGSGVFTVNGGALNGAGEFLVSIAIDCPGSTPDTGIAFFLYIDPSGTVIDTSGDPIAGATVTLYRADSVPGPYSPVSDGSALLSPENRSNPDTTGTDGAFAWFTAPGAYRVRAERAGCHRPGDPSVSYVETANLLVPPEWTGLILTLECPPTYRGLSPARLLDSRGGQSTVDGLFVGGGVVGAGGVVELQVTGRGGVPLSGVGAVVLNVTSTEASAPSFVTVWPTGEERPNASSVNTEPGQDTPNLVIAKVGAGGRVSLFNDAGSGHLIADVVGWFPAGSAFTGLSPARLLDSRGGQSTVDGLFVGGGVVGAGGVVELQVTGRGGVPLSGVGAVVLNVTSTEASAPSFVTVWPTGEDRPNASSVNTEPGQDTPNLVIAKVGAGGRVSLFNNAGSGHLIADVVGWFPAGSAFTGLSPARLLDSRGGQSTVDGLFVGGGVVGAGGVVELQVTGRGGVPLSGVGAVVLNVTSTEASAPSFVTVWPTGEDRPNASSVNTEPGQDTPNLVIAKVGAGGRVSLFNNAGSGHLIADVVGWFPAG